MTLGDVKNRREIRDSRGRMTPKGEEYAKICSPPFSDGTIREKQRPPIYNPEDYAIWLRKWGKKSANGSLYTTSSMSDLMELSHPQRTSFKDYRNPMMSSSGMEMTLRQFGSASELLTKLRSDLRLAYPSFVQEFVADPLDGVSLLLDLLRAIHLSQSNPAQTLTCSSSSTTLKIPLAVQRRAMLDELACLHCLLSCCSRYSEAVRKIISSSTGMFTLAVCIMSNVNKSRIAALQLLSKVCEPKSNGHSVVSEAMSTLRLRFGEPVRFRFLVGMLSSAGGQSELLAAGLKFLNTFLNTAGSTQKRLYLQAELEQAGFDIEILKKNIGMNINSCDPIFDELDSWEKHYIDIESISIRMESAEKENDSLREKLSMLQQKIQVLKDEKGILISLDQCLRDKCSELREEVHSLKSTRSADIAARLKKNHDESTPDDEGISSSERTPTPEEEIQQPCVYDIFPTTCTPIPLPRLCDHESEEETTIEEVIQELRDIISNEETENYNRENIKITQDKKQSEECQIIGKTHTHLDIDDIALGSEYEIIPSNLLPQPPRRARSLMHLFEPAEDYGYCNREIFFDKESLTSESSSSLVSSSKYCRSALENKFKSTTPNNFVPAEPERHTSKTNIRRSESFMELNNVLARQLSNSKRLGHSTTMERHAENLTEDATDHMKCKSLDRIGDGLGSLVDIVVTGQNSHDTTPHLSKSDSGNASSASACNIFVCSVDKPIGSKLSVHSEEKQRMFLPSQGDQNEVLYYFPRILEKRNSSSSGFFGSRGCNNAGLYSGHMIDNLSYFSRSKEVVGSDCHSSGKLTDYPSGLY